MLNIKEVIIVEGRYDRCKLSQIVNADIVETSGFSIYNDAKLRHYILSLAQKRGIILLTDSDSAGFQIRNYIKSFVPAEYIKNAYIPDIYGKERRKAKASRENKLGVEGIDGELILKALKECGANEYEAGEKSPDFLSKADFFALGLSGGENSAVKRKILTDCLNLPERISANALISYINLTLDEDEFHSVCHRVGLE